MIYHMKKGGLDLASQGSIITRVYTSDAYIPLRDVPVIYTQRSSEGKRELLAIRMTNSSGTTDPYFIETPDTASSLEPQDTLRPYSTIDISVSLPGYSSSTAEGVQIFPGVETVQGFQLRPIPASERDPITIYPEPPQDL